MCLLSHHFDLQPLVSLHHGDFGVFTVEVELPAVKPELGSASSCQHRLRRWSWPTWPRSSSFSRWTNYTTEGCSFSKTQRFPPHLKYFSRHFCFNWSPFLLVFALVEKYSEDRNTGAILLIKPGKDCCQAKGPRCERGRMSEGWKESQCSEYSGGLKTVSECYRPLASLLL